MRLRRPCRPHRAALVASAFAFALAAACNGETPADGSSPTASPQSPSASPSASPSTSSSVEPTTGGPSAPLPTGGPVPADLSLTSVSATGDVVHALGAQRCAAQRGCVAVLRLVGQTWRSLPAPAATPTADGPLTPGTVDQVRFADARNGWTFGRGLWSTHDAGATWVRRDPGGTVYDLATNGRDAYAVVSSCRDTGGGEECGPYRLMRSRVGTDSWTQVVAPGPLGASLSLGGNGGGVALVGKGLHVLRDGAWVSVTGGCRAGETSRFAVASVTGSRLFHLCSAQPDGFDYAVSSSDDAGRTWRRGGTVRLAVRRNTLAAASPTVLLAPASGPESGGKLQRSADGGRTWTVVDQGLPSLDWDGKGWSQLGARSADRLVAVPAGNDGRYWVSDDAGRTWTPIRPR